MSRLMVTNILLRTCVLSQSNMGLSVEANQMKSKLALQSEHSSSPKRTLFLSAGEARYVYCACKVDFGLGHQLSYNNNI